MLNVPDPSEDAPHPQRRPEVERKFDVVATTVSPSFEGIAAVAYVKNSPTQSLDAVYFDTPAQDLARHKITLRRRTGGEDAGWHLKLPAGSYTRTELSVPLTEPGPAGHDRVPSELLDVVLAIVRDRPLEPVARIATKRENRVLYGVEGTALVTFSDDHVAAWSGAAGQGADASPAEQEWREWELELVSGTAPDTDLLSRLSNRLLDAGAAPADYGSKLARVLGSAPEGAAAPEDPLHRAVAEQYDQLLVWDRAVRADAYDSVHQMRVTTRKIRSLLRESGDWLGLSDTGWVLSELRELAGVLGGARDAEVLAERYEQHLSRLPAELVRGPIYERLVKGARHRYQVGLRRSLLAMRSQRYFRVLDALDSLVAEMPVGAPGVQAAGANIAVAYKKVRKAAKVAAKLDQPDDSDQDNDAHRDEALHRIRKRAKRLRYTAAATGADEVARQAKAIQSLLGDHQDSVVSREYLIREAQAAHVAGEDTFTYGLLYQLEADLAERCHQQLAEGLHNLARAVRKTRD